MNIHDIIVNINAGNFDNDLERIKSAIDSRCSRLSGVPTLHQLRVGQPVWFNHHTRPTYLIGKKAKIHKINRTRVSVILEDGGIGRFSGGPIRTSLELLSTTPVA